MLSKIFKSTGLILSAVENKTKKRAYFSLVQYVDGFPKACQKLTSFKKSSKTYRFEKRGFPLFHTKEMSTFFQVRYATALD